MCVSVCYQSAGHISSLYIKLNMPVDFTPFSRGFQLTDFSKNAPLKSYSFIGSFCIQVCHFLPFLSTVNGVMQSSIHYSIHVRASAYLHIDHFPSLRSLLECSNKPGVSVARQPQTWPSCPESCLWEKRTYVHVWRPWNMFATHSSDLIWTRTSWNSGRVNLFGVNWWSSWRLPRNWHSRFVTAF